MKPLTRNHSQSCDITLYAVVATLSAGEIEELRRTLHRMVAPRVPQHRYAAGKRTMRGRMPVGGGLGSARPMCRSAAPGRAVPGVGALGGEPLPAPLAGLPVPQLPRRQAAPVTTVSFALAAALVRAQRRGGVGEVGPVDLEPVPTYRAPPRPGSRIAVPLTQLAQLSRGGSTLHAERAVGTPRRPGDLHPSRPDRRGTHPEPPCDRAVRLVNHDP
jgi:hypothetical protein